MHLSWAVLLALVALGWTTALVVLRLHVSTEADEVKKLMALEQLRSRLDLLRSMGNLMRSCRL